MALTDGFVGVGGDYLFIIPLPLEDRATPANGQATAWRASLVRSWRGIALPIAGDVLAGGVCMLIFVRDERSDSDGLLG